jgi:hypothetical protein
LFQSKSVSFLHQNAERALYNLKNFSFSDLEIVSHSGQTVCAKLAEKMRAKMLDEQLEDVHLSFQGQVQGPFSQEFLNNESFSQQNSLKTVLDKIVNAEKANSRLSHWHSSQMNYFAENEIRLKRSNQESISFQVQKPLLDTLFPGGFKLKTVDLDSSLDHSRNDTQINEISQIDEEDEEHYNYETEISVRGSFYYIS